MTTYKRIITSPFFWLLIFVAIIFKACNSFSEGMCQNQVYSQTVSPNGTLKAVVFQRDCGATTGFSTQISIIDVNNQLENESGNIFVMNGHPENTNPILTWSRDNHSLNISLSTDNQIFVSKTEYGIFNAVNVTYSKDGS